MKKIIITCSIVFSGLGFGQQSSENPFIYEEAYDEGVLAEDTYPGNPGDPDSVPVDEYVPALLVMALAMIVVYRKRHSISE